MTTLTRWVSSLGLMAALILTGCTSPGEPATLEEKLAKHGFAQGEAIREVKNYRIDGWNYLDTEHLIFSAGPSGDYMVTLSQSCTDLRSAEDIAFTSTNNNLTAFESVVVATPTGRRRCPIESLHTLSKLAP
ncbi:DUF6491 family protein [Spongiibacter taiwanensis]|uniref:DUF6491 family protein n=1 Tax=Spongiibacter taiwanensis TaxID=1748242 RepID=UPI00203537DA|nr:DUF6491 family protein [Spongiibacter taiwanensis]USA41719.1 DUF6491 family protein [Spongiibacter taiwanensis]